MPSRRPPFQTINRYRRLLSVLTGSVIVLVGKAIFYIAPIAAVEYQIDISGKQYYGCIFGDSISAGVGNTFGDNTYNFAVGGLSSTSLVEQLKKLVPTNVKCQTAVIAIGTNDAAYGTSDVQFIQNMEESISLVQSMGAKRVVLIPAFYSTVAASYNPRLAGTTTRVEEINALIRRVAAIDNVPVEAGGIQPLFDDRALKEDLTKDGVHLNAKGVEIYKKALLKILNYTP